jgi:hypothetical protein
MERDDDRATEDRSVMSDHSHHHPGPSIIELNHRLVLRGLTVVFFSVFLYLLVGVLCAYYWWGDSLLGSVYLIVTTFTTVGTVPIGLGAARAVMFGASLCPHDITLHYRISHEITWLILPLV